MCALTDNSSFEQLAEAVAKAYLTEEEKNSSETYTPSVQHKRWVKTHIYGRKKWRFYSVARRIAAVFAVFLLLGFSVVTINAARTPGGVRFYLEEIGDWFRIWFYEEDVQNAPDFIETVYFPTYMPDGYVLKEKDVSYLSVSGVWEDSKGNWITFSQHTLGAWSKIKKDNTIELMIGGIRALYSEATGLYTYMWYTDDYLFYLDSHVASSMDEIEKIISSIKEDLP